MNAQKLRFSVVSDKAKLKEYSTRGKTLYLQFMKEAGIQIPELENNLNNPDYDIFYGAPTVIFIYCHSTARLTSKK